MDSHYCVYCVAQSFGVLLPKNISADWLAALHSKSTGLKIVMVLINIASFDHSMHLVIAISYIKVALPVDNE